MCIKYGNAGNKSKRFGTWYSCYVFSTRFVIIKMMCTSINHHLYVYNRYGGANTRLSTTESVNAMIDVIDHYISNRKSDGFYFVNQNKQLKLKIIYLLPIHIIKLIKP